MSYSEIKHALNSTVGTPDFKTLDVLIKEKKSSMRADFSRFRLIEQVSYNITYDDLKSNDGSWITLGDINTKGLLLGNLKLQIQGQGVYLYPLCSDVHVELEIDFGYTKLTAETTRRINSGEGLGPYLVIEVTSPSTKLSEVYSKTNWDLTVNAPAPIEVDKVTIRYKVTLRGRKYPSSLGSVFPMHVMFTKFSILEE